MDNARISIVIPVYNRAGIVQRTLASVASQTARPLDIILVDNNSTDGTVEVLGRWKNTVQDDAFRVTVLSEKKPGAAAARNRGLEAVTTEWVMFFDSDDTMAPLHISRALLVIDDVMRHDLKGNSSRNKFSATRCQWHSLFNGSMATLRWCARTALVRRAGGWNPDIRFWDDIELGARMLALNPMAVHAGKEITVFVHESAECISCTSNAPTLSLMEPALQSIARTLPPGKKNWCELKRVIQAAISAAEDPRAARDVLNSVLGRTSSPAWRMIWHAAYTYTRLGGHGAARILRPLMSIVAVLSPDSTGM